MPEGGACLQLPASALRTRVSKGSLSAPSFLNPSFGGEVVSGGLISHNLGAPLGSLCIHATGALGQRDTHPTQRRAAHSASILSLSCVEATDKPEMD